MSINQKRKANLAPGAGKTGSSTHRPSAKPRPKFNSNPVKRMPPKPQPAQQDDDAGVDVPEVGWLWTAGQRSGSGDSGSEIKQPSAQMTVANLRKDRIDAKKSLGQNFLTDDNILKDIVSSAGVKQGDCVLEVGPGTGNLTKHLLSSGAVVTAVEKDDTLYARLKEEYAQEPRLSLTNADVLRIKPEVLLKDMMARHEEFMAAQHDAAHDGASSASNSAGDSNQPQPSHAGGQGRSTPAQRKVKVVANLPYNITKDFLKALLPMGEYISELHIMLQEEAGVRLVHGKAGDWDYRSMNIRVAYYCKPKYRFMIPKEKYYPVPGVDGALITFALLPPSKRPALAGSERSFLTTVDKGFSSRRKMLRNSMQPLHTSQQVDAALVAIGMPGTSRAEDLTPAQWVDLYNTLTTALLKEETSPDAETDKDVTPGAPVESESASDPAPV